jgi:hypothetical protein
MACSPRSVVWTSVVLRNGGNVFLMGVVEGCEVGGNWW